MKSVVSHFMRNSLNDFYPDYASLLFQIKQYLLVYLLDRQRYMADTWTRYMVNFGPCPYYKDKLLTGLFTENTVSPKFVLGFMSYWTKLVLKRNLMCGKYKTN